MATHPGVTPTSHGRHHTPTGWYILTLLGFLVGMFLYGMLFVLILFNTDHTTTTVFQVAAVAFLVGSPATALVLIARDLLARAHARGGEDR